MSCQARPSTRYCGDSCTYLWRVGNRLSGGAIQEEWTLEGSSVNTTFTKAGWTYGIELTVRETEEATNPKAVIQGVAVCKYVRREYRSLQDDDRVKFFSAVSEVYRLSMEEGKDKYGDKFRNGTVPICIVNTPA